jgi:DNA-binding transcriptional LysR family regulator
MNWDAIGFDWNRARAFLATAEEGSLSAAARALGSTQPTIGRQIAALEEELDIVLFERVGRGLVITPSGRELLKNVREMGEAATKMALAALGQSQSLEGPIRITASEVVSAFLLWPIVGKLRADHPGIDIEIVASNQATDLAQREADIAIRNFRPTDSELVARKVKDVAVHLYAAPTYLKRMGPIHSVADLARAEFVGFDSTGRLLTMLNELGFNLTSDNFPVISESHLVIWEYVKRGIGIGLMQEDIAAAEPGVVRIETGLAPIMIPIWLTTHREVTTSRRIRLVFDLLYHALRTPLGR